LRAWASPSPLPLPSEPLPSDLPSAPFLPSSPTSRHNSNRAHARYQQNSYEGCLEDARESVRLNAGYAKGWLRMGQALHKLGRHQEGAEAFGSALQAEPGNAAAGAGRDMCLSALKGGSGGGSSGGSARGSSAALRAQAPGGLDPAALAGLMGSMGGAGGGGGDPMANPMVKGMMATVAKDPELAKSMMDPEVMACVWGGGEGAGGGASAHRTYTDTHTHSHTRAHARGTAASWQSCRGPWRAGVGLWLPCLSS
jgi:hypothetical protein